MLLNRLAAGLGVVIGVARLSVRQVGLQIFRRRHFSEGEPTLYLDQVLRRGDAALILEQRPLRVGVDVPHSPAGRHEADGVGVAIRAAEGPLADRLVSLGEAECGDWSAATAGDDCPAVEPHGVLALRAL